MEKEQQHLSDARSLAYAASIGKPHVAARRLLWAIGLTFAVLLVWAGVSKVDEITRAPGRVIPSAKLQTLQSMEGGVVKSIEVKPGALVQAGDLLVSLSTTQADSDFESRQQQVFALKARSIRLQAELQGRIPDFPEELRTKGAAFVAAEMADFNTRRDRRESDLAIAQAQLEQRKKEADDTRVNLATLDSSLVVAKQEHDIVAAMVERGLEPRLELVRQDARMVELQGKRDSARLAVPRLMSAVLELESKRELIARQYRNEASTDAAKVAGELNSQLKLMPSLAYRLERTEIRAPVRGIVNRVFTSTIGGVIKPGEAVVEVVPAEGQLVVEANISPKDIGFIKLGQMARVKLTAYDYSIFGSLPGKVSRISPDAVQVDEKNSAFQVQVETSTTALEVLGKKLPIVPGMQAEVEIVTGSKTVLQYITKPLVAVRENAFRER